MILCGFGAMFVSAVCFLAPCKLAITIIAVLIVALFLFALSGGAPRFTFLIPIIIIILLVALNATHKMWIISQHSSLKGVRTVRGTVSEIIGYDTTVGYVIDADRVGNIRENCRIIVMDKEGAQLAVGDRLSISVSFSENNLTEVRERADGIYFVGYLHKVHSVHHDKPIIYSLRENIRDILSRSIGAHSSGLLKGIVLGDKSVISSDIKAAFSGAGVSHIIVVSGLHVAVLAGGIYSFLRKLKISNRKTGVLGILLVALLMAVTGFTVSVLRAGLAYIIMFIGVLLNRKPDPLNSLFLAITIILLENPFAFLSVSFQLSSAATFGVLMVAPGMYESEREVSTPLYYALMAIKRGFAFTLSASLMTMPFLIYHFGSFVPIVFLSNMFVIPLANTALVLSFFAVIAFFLPQLSHVITIVAAACAELIIFITERLSRLPFATLTFENRAVPTVLSTAVAVLAAIYYIKRYEKIIKIRDERAAEEWLQSPSRN